jgi:hypothetical protein
MFKKDSYLAGILTGILFPVICYWILFGLKMLAGTFMESAGAFTMTKMMFAATALNVLPIRYFYVSRNSPKTAQGILVLTTVMIVTVLLAF